MKKSPELPKQPIFKAIYNSRFFLPSFIGIILCVVVIAIFVGTKPDPLNSADVSLGIPASWTKISMEHHSGLECTLSDSPCPSLNVQYQIPKGEVSGDLERIAKNLSGSGYSVESCINDSPSFECVTYYIDANKGGISVSVIVYKEDSSTAQVKIQPN